MILKHIMLVGTCLAAAVAPVAGGQENYCITSPDAAVRCFVSNAVRTHLTTTRFGLTLPEFQAYGVAVSKILLTQHTYIVLVGVASAVADAMPPTNADGSRNVAAQDDAVNTIVTASTDAHFASAPVDVTLQDLKWFALDLVGAMNQNSGYMQLLTPGVGLRMINSYVLSGTSGSSVDWTEVDAKLSDVVDNMLTSRMIKLPNGMTADQVKRLVDSIARAIQSYKVATGRKSI
ncbi:MAG: hypothetical protein WCA91_17450 [Candidatus Acidiferrales bacterium]